MDNGEWVIQWVMDNYELQITHYQLQIDYKLPITHYQLVIGSIEV